MKKLQPIYAVLLTLCLLYAFSSNPPNANTGAPGEGNCTSCHTGSNASFDGSVAIQGLPEIIIPNTTYSLSVVTKVSAGSPARAGFQMVVLDNLNNNAGNLNNAGNGAAVMNQGGKNYFEHSTALPFNSIDSVEWTVEWTAPATIASDSIKVYINSILGNGGGSGNDLMVKEQTAYGFQTAVALPIEITIIEVNDLSCFEANDGSATVSASGGTGAFTYKWSIDSTTASISNLSIGRYIVTATDSEGSTGTATVTIDQPDEILISVDNVVNISCNEPIGGATITASGGVAPYTYLWSTDSTTTTVNLPAGTHSVTVTDANQCTSTTSVTINEDIREPIAFAGLDVLITCEDTNTATAQLDAFNTTTGTGVTYLWTTTNGNIVSGATTLMPIVDATGNYILTVINGSNGCVAVDTVIATFNTLLPIANAGADQVIDCDNTSATLDGSSSSQNDDLTYSWTSLAGNFGSGENTLMPVVTSAGTYILTVERVGSCIAIDSVLVTQDANMPEVMLSGNLQIGCADSDTIQIAGNATMGDNIIYSWTTNGGVIIGDRTTLQTVIIGAGSYTLTATDTLNNCSSNASFEVTTVMPPIAVAGMDRILDCANENLVLDGSESTGNHLIFEWSTMDGNFIGASNIAMPTVDEEGIYILTVTDTLTGCSTTDEVEITEDTASDLFAASGDAEQLTCAKTSMMLNATATVGDNIIYKWTTEEGNIVIGGNSLTPTIDQPGKYILTVLDTLNGCTAVSTIKIAQDITLPTVNAGDSQTLDCNTTSLTLVGRSDTEFNLTYNWTTIDGNIINGANTLTPEVNAAGTYILTVVDTFTSCAASASVEIITDAALPVVNAGTMQQLDCNNDTLTLAGTGSIGDSITILWTTEDGNILDNSMSFTPMVDAAGTYTLTVTDTTSGCSNMASVIIIEDIIKPMVEAGAANQSFCDSSTLTINATASEGDNFTYFWCTEDGSIISGGDALTVEIDDAGLFELIVTNAANGCKNVDSVLVTSLESPVLSLDTMNDTTNLVVINGTLPYMYEWIGTAVSLDSSLANLAPGDYTVTVTDANGCTDDIMFTIDESTSLEAIESSIESLQVFPNPTSDFVDINLTFNEVQAGQILILNKVGQQIWQQNFEDRTINLSVAVNEWSAGIYYMMIQTEKGVKTEEIVVIR